MWAPLQHPRHVTFYQEFHARRSGLIEDWEPMVHAVRYLQAHPDAPRLFAFTSLVHFQVTTAPTYAERDGHPLVSITWKYQDRLFQLSFGWCDAGWDEAPSHGTCDEHSFPTAVEPLLQRLLHSPPSSGIDRNS